HPSHLEPRLLSGARLHPGDWIDVRSREFPDGCAVFSGEPEDQTVVAPNYIGPSRKKPGCASFRQPYLGLPPLPGARIWSRAMGPAPKKIRANARVARDRGNS